MAETGDAHHSVDEELNEVVEEEGSGLATTLVTGAAVAIFAPELLPGMAIGVAAMLAPRLLPALGSGLRPLLKTAVRASYVTAMKTKELAAEAGEQMQDMVAEVRAEEENGGGATKGRRTRSRGTKRRARA